MEDTGENGGDGRHMGCTLFWSFHGRTGNGAGIATVLGWFAMVRPDDREGRRKGKRNSSSVLLWLVDGAAVRPVRERDTTKKRFKMALIKWRLAIAAHLPCCFIYHLAAASNIVATLASFDKSLHFCDYVLALTVENFLERHLQTLVFNPSMAKSIHHARLILEKVNAAINDMASYAEANAYIREVEAF
ncbi:hypothetical protein Ahy_B09g099838 isoform I [Arachis hypogaea]|uniref:Uncharacterized protein n=1 Tax=Arachis hypogaea TaxID=3818 RepID=A0A444XVZ2_ARAHY|nr:hypothetical protein Ahy_B09g099838 isoform I [Arachis hypogaea]